MTVARDYDALGPGGRGRLCEELRSAVAQGLGEAADLMIIIIIIIIIK